MDFSRKQKFIAIAVFTKRLGFAVFSREDLLYFAVKTLKSSQSIKTQIYQTVDNLNAEFHPKFVVLKTLSKQQSKSKTLKSVLRQIKKVVKSKEIPVKNLALELAKREMCEETKPTKTNLFQALTSLYPELKRLVYFQSMWQAEYYNSLLSAVVIGYYWKVKNFKHQKSDLIT